jgi:hypothetical protein
MKRSSWINAAAFAAAIGMAAPTLAFAQTAPAQATAATYTDAQIQAFAAASAEIDPISRSLPTASATQRTEAAARIRTVLQQHNLDSNTYNSIAAQAQTDTALAARINAARPAPAQPAAPETTPPTQN